MSGTHKIPHTHTHHSKKDLVETARMRHRHHSSPRGDLTIPKPEEATPTSLQTIMDSINVVEAGWSWEKIRAKTHPPATKQRNSDSDEELRRTKPSTAGATEDRRRVRLQSVIVYHRAPPLQLRLHNSKTNRGKHADTPEKSRLLQPLPRRRHRSHHHSCHRNLDATTAVNH